MKYLVSLIIVILPLSAFSNHDKDRKWDISIEPRIDYTHEYYWNINRSKWDYQGEWVNRFAHDYEYVDDLLVKITTKVIETGEFTERETFEYDEKQNMVRHLYQIFNDGSWQDERQDILVYNELQQIQEIIVQYWINGTWTNNRRQYQYLYDERELNTSYMRQHWVTDEWVDKTLTNRYYNEDSLLIERIVSNVNNPYKFRFEYSYDEYQNCINLIYQESSGERWENTWQDFYTFNRCGQKYKKIRQTWTGEEWSNHSKWITYFTIDIDPKNKHDKIPVCHKGHHTIYIPYAALKAHLKHGDCIGPCQAEKNCRDCDKKSDPPVPPAEKYSKQNFHSGEYYVYPNPLRNRSIVKLGDSKVRRMDLINSRGTILRSYQIKDEKEIILHRKGLNRGIYFLRFISDEVIIKKLIII